MLAHAFLAAVRADEHARHPAPEELIPLTCNEIQRLFVALVVRPVHDAAHWLGWSDWRRRHQARSRVGLPPAASVQARTAVASISTRWSGTSSAATPSSVAGGTGVVPSFAAAREIPSRSGGILSGVQSTT